MQLSQRINRLKDRTGGKNQLTGTIVAVMREMKWSYTDVMEMPVPSYIVILDELMKIARKEKAEMKKKR
jgi:hypothetical protein|tara:strand:- start:3227 stop:3433 length:207 start_codon:yes stop_codon:yes gene_type:complete